MNFFGYAYLQRGAATRESKPKKTIKLSKTSRGLECLGAGEKWLSPAPNILKADKGGALMVKVLSVFSGRDTPLGWWAQRKLARIPGRFCATILKGVSLAVSFTSTGVCHGWRREQIERWHIAGRNIQHSTFIIGSPREKGAGLGGGQLWQMSGKNLDGLRGSVAAPLATRTLAPPDIESSPLSKHPKTNIEHPTSSGGGDDPRGCILVSPRHHGVQRTRV